MSYRTHAPRHQQSFMPQPFTPQPIPGLPTRQDFFSGLRTAIDNIEQAIVDLERTGQPRERDRHHGHRKDCGCGHSKDHGYGHDKHYGRHKDCDCYDCYEDPCACHCCVGDADLVVKARVGERRVVPLRIVNEFRRERDIQLELSDFRGLGGGPSPVTAEVEPQSFTLPPCGEKDVVLTINVANQSDDNDRPDVDVCTTVYADLRVVGCDIRPKRIAVVLLPRACDAYTVGCGCGCC